MAVKTPTAGTQTAPIGRNELAGLLGISTRTLRRWELKGLIPRPASVGMQRYWKRDVIDDWIASGCPARRDWERLRPQYRKVAR
jgi:predicted DNA-binding transcriptional regulator AlpA